MTAQICSMFFNHGFFHIRQANVIIFDECHKATKSHPYARIMARYHESMQHQQAALTADSVTAIVLPRILGLTPSLINKDTKSTEGLENEIKKLAKTLNSIIETTNDLKAVHKTKPQVSCRWALLGRDVVISTFTLHAYDRGSIPGWVKKFVLFCVTDSQSACYKEFGTMENKQTNHGVR